MILLRMSILIGMILFPLRLAHRPAQAVTAFAGLSVIYYGILDVILVRL